MDKKPISVLAGYFDGDMLFEIYGLLQPLKSVPAFVARTFAHLTRGAPTQPSIELQHEMKFNWNTLQQNEPLALVGSKIPDWSQTIRGAEDGRNPAKTFFEEILPLGLQEWDFVRQLMVPECPIFQILLAPDTEATPSAELVDFYLPQANLVIEIDGSQHTSSSQRRKDEARDRTLANHKITVMRLSTEDLRREGPALQSFFVKLKAHLDQSPRLKPYKTEARMRRCRSPSLRNELTAALRLQCTISVMIGSGALDPSAGQWHLDIRYDLPKADRDWISAGINDLFTCFALFAALTGETFKRPKLRLGKGGLPISVELFSRPDDHTWKAEGIIVRTAAVQIVGSPNTGLRLRDGIAALSGKPSRPVDLGGLKEDFENLTRYVFGHDRFREGQLNLITNALEGQRSIGLMPTGGGKSLCFQLPAILRHGVAIVVVPINALGRDHVAELEAIGFKRRVASISAETGPDHRKIILRKLAEGQLRFLFVSPERFQTEEFRSILETLGSQGIGQFVIDEIHCMSEWGHDFRPSYLTLPKFLREIGEDIPIIGLSATVSVNVLRDIQSEFSVPEELVHSEMDRPREELVFDIRPRHVSPDVLLEELGLTAQLGETMPPTHVFARYVNGRTGVWMLGSRIGAKRPKMRVGLFAGSKPKDFNLSSALTWLRDENFPRPAGWDEYKKTVQDLWKQGRLDVIVTTKAFGMGVNKPDVRRTIHAGMPSSIEAFYQEAGRAGRDRQTAKCIMLFSRETDSKDALRRLRDDLISDPSPTKFEAALAQSRGDLRSQLWFMNQGNISLQDETRLVARLRDKIAAEPGDTMVVARRDLDAGTVKVDGLRFQVSLYRLYQLGLIEPWTVTDWGRGDSGVEAVQLVRRSHEFSEACDALRGRMQAVAGRSAETEELSQIDVLSEQDIEDWRALVALLLTWIRRTQMVSRFQSTFNLYDSCMSFTPEHAENFRENLEAFFRIDGLSRNLSMLRDLSIHEAAAELSQLLRVPDGSAIKERAALEKMYQPIRRLRESTLDNPGFNLAAACIELLLDEADASRIAASLPGGITAFWQEGGSLLLVTLALERPDIADSIAAMIVAEHPSKEQLFAISNEMPAPSFDFALMGHLAYDLEELL